MKRLKMMVKTKNLKGERNFPSLRTLRSRLVFGESLKTRLGRISPKWQFQSTLMVPWVCYSSYAAPLSTSNCLTLLPSNQIRLRDLLTLLFISVFKVAMQRKRQQNLLTRCSAKPLSLLSQVNISFLQSRSLITHPLLPTSVLGIMDRSKGKWFTERDRSSQRGVFNLRTCSRNI
jgi:hypothetical protein